MKLCSLTCLATLLIGSATLAQSPGDHRHWSAAELDGYAESLAAEVGADNLAVLNRIIDSPNYFAGIVHRVAGPGFSETHRDWADVYFVSSGRGTLIVGGSIPDARETGPGEVRGSSIQGGAHQPLAEGDVVHIPAGTPHHVIAEPGQQITYFILKVQDIRRTIVSASLASYEGVCPCPESVDRAGQRCGSRAAYRQSGGSAVLCYASDVTDEMVTRYRQRMSP